MTYSRSRYWRLSTPSGGPWAIAARKTVQSGPGLDSKRNIMLDKKCLPRNNLTLQQKQMVTPGQSHLHRLPFTLQLKVKNTGSSSSSSQQLMSSGGPGLSLHQVITPQQMEYRVPGEIKRSRALITSVSDVKELITEQQHAFKNVQGLSTTEP